jgi:hypothetical protein
MIFSSLLFIISIQIMSKVELTLAADRFELGFEDELTDAEETTLDASGW